MRDFEEFKQLRMEEIEIELVLARDKLYQLEHEINQLEDYLERYEELTMEEYRAMKSPDRAQDM